jgi:hypothetical protein
MRASLYAAVVHRLLLPEPDIVEADPDNAPLEFEVPIVASRCPPSSVLFIVAWPIIHLINQ